MLLEFFGDQFLLLLFGWALLWSVLRLLRLHFFVLLELFGDQFLLLLVVLVDVQSLRIL